MASICARSVYDSLPHEQSVQLLLRNSSRLAWTDLYRITVLQHGGTGPVGQNNPYFNTNSMLGTGPYMETQVQPTAFAIFEKNPNYWGKNLTAAQIANNPILDPGHYNKILINYKPDDTTRYVDLTTGASQISAVFVSNFN